MQGLTVEKVTTNATRSPISVGSGTPPVPAMLQRALESLWVETAQKARSIPEDGFASLEKEFRERLLKLAANLLGEALSCALGTGYEGPRIACETCGGRAKFMGHRPRTITTLVQEIRLKRSYYYCKECGHGQVPLDETLSLNGTSFSPGVREVICLVDAEIPFERGGRLLEKLSAIRLAKEEGRRISEELGEELEQQTLVELENVWRPKTPVPRELGTEPARLYFSPDGTTVHVGNEWKEAKVGTVFTTGIPRRGEDPEREHTRYVATMGNVEDLGKRMYVEALKLGLNARTEVIVVADGAHWIWNWAAISLPKRIEIIDFYHAAEKLSEVRRTVFGEENPKGIAWAERWRKKLHAGKVEECIGALKRLKPRSKEGRESVRKTIGYYENNRQRMRYEEFRKRGYFIGSGVTESSCKRLVGARLKQAGMRWRKEGAQEILQLRLAVLNERWDYMWAGRMMDA